MSVTAACPNGRPRKQLSDQLDRLDGIIDVLADALPEAVRDAVRDGMADALRQLVAETLADPTTLALVRHAVAPPPPGPPAPAPGPSRRAAFLARCRAGLAAVRAGGVAAGRAAAAAVRVRVARCRAGVAAARARAAAVAGVVHVAWHLKRAAAVGLAAGGAVAAVSLVSHPVATALSGLGGAVAAFGVHTALVGRRAARRWGG
ncbi:hypothetical protein [Limnoglobus roseus]|uniref:Uncharacterized protein n=1 Tax=Limnoglobus roseus TaxID=2598579 RepID=A0A5C1AG99_9BACT|nr:hypothetical protein [Limnoglobus roseus]QEL17655.1 hypothetical protein PX52LOC_04653 [Limnoglobus roseus]